MGNVLDVLGCSGRGDKILSASREGDVEEVSKILSVAPILAKYSSFGTRLSPLHLASARGHVEVSFLCHPGTVISPSSLQP